MAYRAIFFHPDRSPYVLNAAEVSRLTPGPVVPYPYPTDRLWANWYHGERYFHRRLETVVAGPDFLVWGISFATPEIQGPTSSEATAVVEYLTKTAGQVCPTFSGPLLIIYAEVAVAALANRPAAGLAGKST